MKEFHAHCQVLSSTTISEKRPTLNRYLISGTKGCIVVSDYLKDVSLFKEITTLIDP